MRDSLTEQSYRVLQRRVLQREYYTRESYEELQKRVLQKRVLQKRVLEKSAENFLDSQQEKSKCFKQGSENTDKTYFFVVFVYLAVL